MSNKIYIDVNNEIKGNSDFKKLKKAIIKLVEEKNETAFIINHPLSDKQYEYSDGFVILIPGYKIIFSSISSINNENFENYYEDFIEDLSSLSNKYNYKEILGYSRKWKKELISKCNIKRIEFSEEKLPPNLGRKSKMLISLLTGSINDINKIGSDVPSNMLQAVKKRIILLDADQTRFIYNDLNKKQISIQGLAGTGKTELLLHKIFDLYNSDRDIKVVFTCFNTILANAMPKRIVEFFNFMKYEQQLEWNEKIWAMRSWGSRRDPNSGVYSYICNYYNLQFSPYSKGIDFDDLCKEALTELERVDNFQCCFDYMLIDEGQDFGDNFFKLCEKVTSKQVIVASDIYQNIFDKESKMTKDPDFILNKVYRTDPRNFMFAQLLGFGVKEDKVINWPKDRTWENCGYILKKDKDNYTFTREPLNRFPEIKDSPVPIEISIEESHKLVNSVINIIDTLQKDNLDITPDDIAIIIFASNKRVYQIADKLEFEIKDRFNWDSLKAYADKENHENKVFISNKNNIKGLEFPFVICVADSQLESNLYDRNALYMSLTRSFITSYLVFNECNRDIYSKYLPLLKQIVSQGKATVTKPSEDKILNIDYNLKEKYLTQDQVIENVLKEEGIYSLENYAKASKFVSDYTKGNSENEIKSLIDRIKDLW